MMSYPAISKVVVAMCMPNPSPPIVEVEVMKVPSKKLILLTAFIVETFKPAVILFESMLTDTEETKSVGVVLSNPIIRVWGCELRSLLISSCPLPIVTEFSPADVTHLPIAVEYSPLPVV
ncbi:MAG: hypothetical protein BWY26_00853 [Elusimicrobia bacterium ADurb.Bin231]|nr:MAG: hypothetical protein BWY26_00853 [Elusimicrobia bacterium ADurb.Bin231]